MRTATSLRPAVQAGLNRAARRLLAGVAACGLISLAALSGLTAVAPSAGAATSPLVVDTREGPVKGVERKGVRQFLGIPFAAPPVGELRWQPPQPAAKRSGTLKADSFGPRCAQIDTLGVFARPSNSEDCLYLNVYTPFDAKARQRPVMVWIYGGGLFDGESNDYDGSKLARAGDTVVVTINYRVNLFGFFSHPALDDEGHATSNYGIMDQQFALDWVRRNIKGFGGDPGNVTIFGESAGGRSVIANMSSPTAKGLFDRAIVESGASAVLTPLLTLEAAEAVGTNFANAVGCEDQTAACLRKLSVKQILAKEGQFRTGTVVDGKVLPRSFDVAFASGKFNRVPVINGSNRDEYNFFIGLPAYNGNNPLKDAADYGAYLRSVYGKNAAKVRAEYPLKDYGSPSEAAAATRTDATFACGSVRFNRLASRYVPVFAYEFADRTAPSYAPPQSFPYGAAHTLEIPYLFPRYHGGLGEPQKLSPAQETLSDQMVSYWTTFADTGNPNSGETPNWPRYKTRTEQYLALQTPSPVVIDDFDVAHKCAFWDKLAGRT